jgi:hypothetical protein
MMAPVEVAFWRNDVKQPTWAPFGTTIPVGKSLQFPVEWYCWNEQSLIATGNRGRSDAGQSPGQFAPFSLSSHTPLPQTAGQVPQSAQQVVQSSDPLHWPSPHCDGVVVVVVGSLVVVSVLVVSVVVVSAMVVSVVELLSLVVVVVLGWQGACWPMMTWHSGCPS